MRAALLALVWLLPALASAHGMRTAYFEVTETAPGVGSATLRMTTLDPELVMLIEGCEMTALGGSTATHTFAFAVQCPSPIAGRTVRAVGLGALLTEAVVRVELSDGHVASGVLHSEQPQLTVRGDQSAARVLLDYLRLGILHVATGFDHLLFLLALTLQLWRVRAVLLAETAFTVSHSLSFSVTALGWVRLSPAAAEACIALSLVLLASELVLRREVSARRGALVALLFGLIHGLGFAGGLREIGLPEHAIGSALLGFGAGVEIGQVCFLGLLLLLLHARPVAHRRAALAWTGGLCIGVTGAFWFCERVAAFAGAA